MSAQLCGGIQSPGISLTTNSPLPEFLDPPHIAKKSKNINPVPWTGFPHSFLESLLNLAIDMSPVNKLRRDEYGALDLPLVLTTELHTQVSALLNDTVNARYLPRPFSKGDAEWYEYLKLIIYDVHIFRGKVKGMVVQERRYWRNICGGHSGSSQSYFLVTRSGRKISVLDVGHWGCARRAKNTTALGQLVKHYLDEATGARLKT